MNDRNELRDSYAPDRRTVILQEVGPRDGLQNEQRVLPPETRASIIQALARAGLPRIQIGAFVNPKRVPQMAGTDRVWRLLGPSRSTRFSVLVLNQRGLDSALAEGVPHVEIYVSASETHSLRNSGVTVQKALAEGARMVRQCLVSGIGVTAGVMCAFGCFYEGAIPVQQVLDMVGHLAASGPVEIGLADTAGIGRPEVVHRVIESVVTLTGVHRVTLHLHDTRGFGMANLQTALSMGVRRFDTSIGGLGGCPFLPGAAGNIATETTAELLSDLGFHTGVIRKELLAVRTELEELLGREL
jgi:hydroxymethylglutaryl-CoA lyase